jgi:hypothetical protein
MSLNRVSNSFKSDLTIVILSIILLQIYVKILEHMHKLNFFDLPSAGRRRKCVNAKGEDGDGHAKFVRGMMMARGETNYGYEVDDVAQRATVAGSDRIGVCRCLRLGKWPDRYIY